MNSEVYDILKQKSITNSQLFDPIIGKRIPF